MSPSRVRARALEALALGFLVAGPDGSRSFGELRRELSDEEPVASTLDRLEARGQVERFPGALYHVTAFGRSRVVGELAVR